jgi:hypothetical protein
LYRLMGEIQSKSPLPAAAYMIGACIGENELPAAYPQST